MKTLKKFFINIILVFAGICLAILLAEVFVRIFYPDSRDHVLPSGLYETDSYLGWRLAKEKSGDHHSKYFNVNYTTNSFGFRDKERIVKKENDKFRILLYGDSQIFGWGVPAEKRFSNLLEESLSDVEIWNLAVPAYGLDQQILLYQRDAVDADAAIFFVTEYTLERIKYDYLYHKSKPRFVIDDSERVKIILPEAPGIIRNFVNSAIKWMYLPFFLEEKISSFSGKPEVQGHLSMSVFNSKNRTTELEKKILLFAKSLTDSRNNLMFILTNRYSLKGEETKEFCVQNGITCFDINLNEKKDNLILGSMDGHWNSRANEDIFKEFLPGIKQLIEKKLVYHYTSN